MSRSKIVKGIRKNDYLVQCGLCGCPTFKSDSKKLYTGLIVCKEHWYPQPLNERFPGIPPEKAIPAGEARPLNQGQQKQEHPWSAVGMIWSEANFKWNGNE